MLRKFVVCFGLDDYYSMAQLLPESTFGVAVARDAVSGQYGYT